MSLRCLPCASTNSSACTNIPPEPQAGSKLTAADEARIGALVKKAVGYSE
jgi:hypothetical protein